MKPVLRNFAISVLALLLLPGSAEERTRQTTPEPLLVVIEQPESKAAEPEGEPKEEEAEEKPVCIRLSDGQAVQTLPLEEYLVGVVLSELPASFADEAFKAQAVAARTFTRRRCAAPKHADCDVCADAACCQAWTSREELKKRLGADFERVWQKAADAVAQTRDEVLLYDGALIDAVYFSCSGGMTEDAAAVWGTDVPYLRSVPSPGEQDAPRNTGERTVQADELRALLQADRPGLKLAGAPETWFKEVERTQGGGVASVCVGGQKLSGTELRALLGLDSTCFELSFTDQAVTFQTRGFGHRVGMSQYGANAMAEQGFDYRTILRYYYRGAEIKKLPGIASGEDGRIRTDSAPESEPGTQRRPTW